MSLPKPAYAVRATLDKGFSEKTTFEDAVAFSKYLSRLLQIRSTEANDHLVNTVRSVSTISMARQKPPAPIHCKSGCNYCCHTHVSVRAPEAFKIARLLRKTVNPETASQIKKNSALYKSHTSDERWAMRRPCALLIDSRCSVYAVRPMMCQLYTSLDVEACRISFFGSDNNIPSPVAYQQIKASISLCFFAASKHAGVSCQGYELHQILEMLLDQPSLESAWYAGSDVLDKCAEVDDLVPVLMQAEVDRLTAVM